MSGNEDALPTGEEQHLESKDVVNTVILVGKGGYVQLDGPFSHTVDGFHWEVKLPLNQDEYAAVDDIEADLVRASIGDTAIAMADGDVESFGEVISADELEGNLMLAAETPGGPNDG